MERGELQEKLQELRSLKEMGLLTEEQVQRTTDELLKAFVSPKFSAQGAAMHDTPGSEGPGCTPLPAVAKSPGVHSLLNSVMKGIFATPGDHGTAISMGLGDPVHPMNLVDSAVGIPPPEEMLTERVKWVQMSCHDTREEAEQAVRDTGYQYLWHSGGGVRGGHTKLCRSHKNCQHMVRISLLKSGWVVSSRGQHTPEVQKRDRGIEPMYLPDIDEMCRQDLMPKHVFQLLQKK